MIKRITTAAAIGLLLSACAGGPPPEPPPPPPLDPTGTFDIAISFDGGELSGMLVIRGSAEEGYTGSIDTDMGGAALADIMVDGQTVTFYIPDADAVVEVVFEGDGFSGGVDGALGAASLSGTKRTKG